MGEGLNAALLLAAIAAGLVSFALLLRYLPLGVSLAVVTVKISLPVVYFAWFYDGSWTFLDDVSYWNFGRQLLAAGYDPLSVLTSAEGLKLLVILSLGPHILYPWWNHLAQFVLGPHYFAPVFFNVVLTVVSGILLFRIARLAGFSTHYARGLLVFFLLHPELLVWSSFVNLKDVMVFTMALMALYSFLRLIDRELSWKLRALNGASLLGVMLLFPFVRFYVPALLVISFGLWLLLRLTGWKRYGVLVSGLAALVLVLPGMVPTQYLEFSPSSVLFGFIKGPLTPRPWAILPEYTFLQLPMILHWLLFFPALIGGYLLWQRSRAAALVLIYLLVTTFLSAIAPEFQGPRHRVHIIFAWAWMQYHIIHRVLWAAASSPVPAPTATVGVVPLQPQRGSA